MMQSSRRIHEDLLAPSKTRASYESLIHCADSSDRLRPAAGAVHARAEALGFAAEAGIDEVVQAFIEGDLQMQKKLV
jgi:hypothetical protein